MPTYGLTPTGFVPKTLDIIRGELAAALQSSFGGSIDVGDQSLLGQLIGILAEREAALWDLAQAVNASQDPAQATGASLDALAALTGTFRVAAAPSLATLTLTGAPGTVVASGSQVKTASTGAVFATTSSATIATLAAWAPSTAYAAGDRRTNASRSYQCITAGTSAASGGPTTTAADITDGTVHWKYLGEGTGAVDAPAASVNTGPVVGVSGDITQIQTPVGGWQTVRNLADATLGADEMSDESLRQLRTVELASSGVATQNAIRAELLLVNGVTSATVFVNNADIANADGMPPHSVEALVQAPPGAEVDQAILNALFNSVAAGIAFQGTTTGTVIDSQGTPQTVKFSRPGVVTVHVDITLIKDATVYPPNGDDLVKQAIVSFGQSQPTGKDAVASGIGARAFSVPGVLDVTSTKIGTSPNPTGSATIAISTRQLAGFDTSRITVHSSSGVP
jgi:uncharacterized phage protein gp47/JayE